MLPFFFVQSCIIFFLFCVVDPVVAAAPIVADDDVDPIPDVISDLPTGAPATAPADLEEKVAPTPASLPAAGPPFGYPNNGKSIQQGVSQLLLHN